MMTATRTTIRAALGALATGLTLSATACAGTEKGPEPPSGMVYCKPGTFYMGSDADKPDEKPKRQETIEKGFFIDRSEVTNAAYKEFCDATQRKAPAHWKDGKIPEGKEDHPVVHVTWRDASDYAQWAGKRLPTEKEWEYAARGPDGRRYPWGDEWDPSADKDRCNASKASRGTTVSAGSLSIGAGPFGTVDQAGNVFEWTADAYTPEPSHRIIKGGSFLLAEDLPRASKRGHFEPDKAFDWLGFRCAQSLPEKKSAPARGSGL
jgi:formylglycine-generating enzyme required for sulfatase activity